MRAVPQPSPLFRAIRASLLCLPLIATAAVAAPSASADADATSPVEATALAGNLTVSTLDAVEVVGEKVDRYKVQGTRTATKTDTPLVDVPQSITIITDELIRDQAMQNMADVVRYVPGVQMALGEGHRDAPILRGNSTTADFFLDGVRDDVQYYRDLYNVERVEVLKGPSGMIFGRGGSGGVINRVTRQANWNDQASTQLSVGSDGGRRITGDVNHAINDDVAFRVTGMYEDSETYRDYSKLERWAVNPTLSFHAGDATTWTLGYEHYEDDRVTDRGIPSMLPEAGTPLDLVDESTYFGNADLSPTWVDVDALTAKVVHDFGGGVELVNHTRYADYDKYYQNLLPAAYTVADGRVALTGYSNFTARQNLLNQTDLTFSAETGSVTHDFLVGMELGRQETDNFRRTAYFTDVSPTAITDYVTIDDTIYDGNVEFRQAATDADNHSVARTAAVYAQDQIEFSPHWGAIVGLRFDRFEADVRNNRTGIDVDNTDNLLSPRAGLLYKPQDNVTFYGSWSIAYVPRAGEQLASLTPTNRNLDPEEFTNVELGAKWDINASLSATAALYRLDRTNVAIVDPNNPAQSLLVDGQRVKGLELGLSGQLTDAWQMMAGFAWQDSEVQTPGLTDGNELGQVPDYSLSLWNRYDFNERWAAGLGVIHQDEVFVATDNAVTLPSFTRVDAAVYFAVTDNVNLQLNVENLFDEEYYASAHSNNNIMPASPRAFRLGLDVNF